MENENVILEYNGDISEHTTDDEQIEKPKKKKKTEKQLQAMTKAREQHLKNARERQAKRALEKEEYNKKVQELEEQHLKYLEDKIVKKALAIKRRTIIEDAYINKVIEIDDVPLDTLNKLVKKLNINKEQKTENTKPIFKFV